MRTLSNNRISISVENHGAELSSIKADGREYLWNADPSFWKRHSPVLFPIVGAVWNGEYRSNHQTYKLGQHGIARDMDFTLVSETKNELMYELRSSEETLQKYPYPFILNIGYHLHNNTIEVIWKVTNPSDKDIFFQIGAHPAFFWPEIDIRNQDDYLQTKDRGYFLLSPMRNEITCSVITEGGCIGNGVEKTVKLENGYLPLDTDTFNDDALIIEHSQVDGVTLCDKNKNPYLSLRFSSPLVGLWSPPHKNAPFVCIEPWYGRTDRVGYDGSFEDKDWMQKLSAHDIFEVSYKIIIH